MLKERDKSLANANLELKRQATHDALTGIANRVLFVERLTHAVYDRQPFAVCVFDLDHFKKVNDTHGHLMGSKLLGEIGEMIKDSCRQIDMAFRYGGDEFVILLPQTSKDNACRVALRLHQRIRERVWLTEDNINAHVTASLGVASYPADAKNKAELLHLADDAMYAVKNSTRDSVMAAMQGVVAPVAVGSK